MTRRLLVAVLPAVVFFSGCLRYTPARDEITDDQSIIVSEDAFFSFEKEQQQRLEDLIAKRRGAERYSASSDYRVGPEDILDIAVFDVEELNTKARVRPSGDISLPLIGAVHVAGFTEAEVQDELVKRLGEYLRVPQAHVFVSEYGAQRVSVIGEVARPGSYALKRNDYSIIELISEAGGRKETASGRVVLIPAPEVSAAGQAASPQLQAAIAEARAKMGPAHGIEIFFDQLTGSVSEAPVIIPLRPGDTIVVPEAGTVEVDGDIKQPGSYPLSARMTLMGAIASAGGLTYSSDVHEVEVIRELEAGKKAALTVDLEKFAIGEGKDVRLRDGDVVRIPSATGRFVTRQVTDAINQVLSFGMSARP